MKRKSREEVKAFAEAWKELSSLLGEYRKRGTPSGVVVTDLEELLKSYEKHIVQAVVQE